MKSITYLTIILFVIQVQHSINAIGQDTSYVKSTFIGSHGYLLETSSKKVALDAHIYWEGSHWGYIKPPVEVKTKIENGDAPFNNLDLILISHDHKDHYNVTMLEQSLKKNTKAIVVTTPQVYTDIKAKVSDISAIDERIWVPELAFYHSIDTVINEIPLVATCIDHGSEKTSLYVFSFVLDDIRFTQLNSWNTLNAEMYDTLGFNQERTDVAFLGYDYIMNNSKLTMFKTKINPVFSTISHIDGASSNKFNIIKNKVDELNPDYPMNLITEPMDEMLIKKVNDTILITTPQSKLISLKTYIPNKIKIYPNPSSKSIHIKLNETEPSSSKFQICNTSGRIVKNGVLDTGEISLLDLNQGVYYLSIYLNGDTYTEKFVVN